MPSPAPPPTPEHWREGRARWHGCDPDSGQGWIIGARWCGPIRHVAEALAAWVPIGFLLAIVGIGGREAVFSNWIHGAPPGKAGWLNPMRVYTTDLAILAVLALTLAILVNL